MKRSEYLRLLDMACDFRSNCGGSYAYDEHEGRYEDGKDAAYESAADSLDDFLTAAVVDVEDVTLCPSTLVFPFVKRDRLHELGTLPYRVSFGRETGCRVCLEIVEKNAEVRSWS